jgi:alkylation response protein AidB-like acyl-CoA dehydrogenase
MASSVSSGESPSLSHFLEQAHAIGQQAERTAVGAERNRQADDGVVHSLIDSGLLKILQPKRFGGYESGFPEFVRVAQILAHYDVSLSWVYCIIGVHHWWGAFVEPELQEELWGKNSNCVFVDSFAPTGQAELADGGFRINGRWGLFERAALGRMVRRRRNCAIRGWWQTGVPDVLHAQDRISGCRRLAHDGPARLRQREH